ncbi:MAG: ribonuclease III [Chlorobiales bacterium]|nr:ribonuclease III [Chlorobiales bacterium]
MEQFWQKLTSFAFPRTEETAISYKIEANHPLITAGLSEKTIHYLQRLVGAPGINLPIYLTALTHRSVVHDPATPSIIESNQRLEFLGDSVLDLLISEYLFNRFPESAEGELSSNRAKIVNRKSLAGFAQSIALGEHLLIGESADEHKIRTSESALADAFESLIGAIYLDKGIEQASNFISHHIIEHVNFNTIVASEQNYKSRLIEYTQSHHLPPPVYSVIEEVGAEHEKSFTIGVTCTDQLLGQGTAQRKKDAEQLAAKEAMERLATEENNWN